MIKETCHTTADEIEFIDHIGTYAKESNYAQSLGKIKIIDNYIIAIDKRKKWVGIDRDEVLTHAVNVLRKFRKEQ